jgi:hypothetical protein
VGWVVYLAVAALIGFALGRWWAAWALPGLAWLVLVGLAIEENSKDPCLLADGCGVGPVLLVAVWGLAWAALLAAAAAAGVFARKRLRESRAGGAAGS